MFCSPFSSFLYTPEFFETSLHVTSIISIPCHILAFYCVIHKTPRSMESVKMTMLALCVWTVILDLQITVLSAPFVMFPAIAGFPLGFLTNLGVSTPIQTIITVQALVGSTTSIACLFANRYSRITMKGSKYQQVYLYAFNFTLSIIGAIFTILNIPDQLPAVQLVYESQPCISSDVRAHPVFVIGCNKTVIGLCIGGIILCILLEYLYFLIASIYHLKFKTNSKVSTRTRNLQQAFFFSIALQIFIPFFIIFVPWIYAIYSCLFDYYNQALNNLLTFDIGLHGIISSISMLLIHKPYRETILRTKSEKNKLEATSFAVTRMFRKTNVIHRNSSVLL